MSYQVFARKYRPQVFEDVVAQDHVTRTLKNAVKNDRVGSGYLFCGPRGTGKTTTARILAKALNCVNGPTPEPCGECPSCKEIASGVSLDVLEIDAASNTGVDDIRTLRENVRYLPTHGKKRIYIIDEIHRLSGAAFDALLKTLEEPPPHVIFIFATTEPLKVPETILSRTQRFDFKRVSATELASHLQRIAEAEHITIEEPALHLLARKADGSVRDSLSLLDQVAAYAGETITEQDVIDALGLVDRQLLFEYGNAVAANDSKRVLQLTDKVLAAGIDVADFVHELLEHFRILLILTVDPNASDVLQLPQEDIDAYMAQAKNFSVGDVVRLMKIIGDINIDLKRGLDERMVLEVAGVKMAELESTVKLEEVLQRLDNGTFTAASGGSDLFGGDKKKSEPHRLSPTATAPSPSSAPLSSHRANTAQLQAGWEAFLAYLRQKSQMLASQLAMAEVVDVTDNEVRLRFGAAGSASKQVVERAENHQVIQTAAREYFKAPLRFTYDIDLTQPGIAIKSNNTNNIKEELAAIIKRSPRLQELLEKVNGEVVGIRKVK